MTKQDYYRRKYKSENPEWNDSSEIYKGIIDPLVDEDTKLLDIGCGHNEYLKDIHKRTKYSYGIDPDENALLKNKFIKNKFIANAENLPFENEYFDVVIMAWVTEHLENPVNVFTEIYRILKPEGKVIFLTPNKLNYNVWIIRMIPDKFHEFFTTKLYNRQDNDTYTKKYKMNTPQSVKNMLTKIGFFESKLIVNGDPSYISFNNFTYRIAVIIEKLLDVKMLNRFKVHLIAEYKK